MSTATLTRRDVGLRDAVIRELEWDPEFDATGIGVAARGGAVTLAGFIDTYAGKLAAERAAKRVAGVRAVANEIEVRLSTEHPDDEIARQAAATLAVWTESHPAVRVTVHRGHLTLTGKVRWIFQKEWAENALQHIPGVVGIVNRIEVAPDATPQVTEDGGEASRRTVETDVGRGAESVDEQC